ncbi:MAG TPA: hypothetical protein PKA90_13025 [Ignavibacteria bacterium]|nr:hypothetical protein [Ignavibacteria bacterium]HMR41342.1 hypothetical protein [Ignavibacteria bacterium]
MEEHSFEMLLTIDKNINFQQDISKYKIILVIINSRSSAIETLSAYIPNLISKINFFEKGNTYTLDL